MQSRSRTRHRHTSGAAPASAGVSAGADALQPLLRLAAGAAGVVSCTLVPAACRDSGFHPPLLLLPPLPLPCPQDLLQGCHPSCTASPCCSSHASGGAPSVQTPAKNGAAAAAAPPATSAAGICRGGSDAGQSLPASDVPACELPPALPAWPALHHCYMSTIAGQWPKRIPEQQPLLHLRVALDGAAMRQGGWHFFENPWRQAAVTCRSKHTRQISRVKITGWRVLELQPPARWRARRLAVGCAATSAGAMPKPCAAAAAASESPPAAKKSEPGSRRGKLEVDGRKLEADDPCRAAVKAASTRASQPPPLAASPSAPADSPAVRRSDGSK